MCILVAKFEAHDKELWNETADKLEELEDLLNMQIEPPKRGQLLRKIKFDSEYLHLGGDV